MPEIQYYVNGDFVPQDEAMISVRDRGFLYGDAAFETLRVYDGHVFEWEAHANRLTETCTLLGFESPKSTDELLSIIHDTLEVNTLTNAYVRISITRGIQSGKLTPQPLTNPSIVVIVAGLPPGGTNGSAVWDVPAAVTIATTRRIPSAAIPARAKTHNYLNGILARLEAVDMGADEAILLDENGSITEGATSNCFFVSDGILHTPTIEQPVLPGITRHITLELAENLTIPIDIGRYGTRQLLDADEIFLTNSTWEVRPVTTVDDKTFAVGPATTALMQAFDEYVDNLIS